MRLLQGSHASRLGLASAGLGSSVAWLVRSLVASGRRLGWSPSAAAGLLVGCFRGRLLVSRWSPGLLRGVRRDGSGRAGWSLIRAGRAALRSRLGCSLLTSCGLRFSPRFACLLRSSVGLRGGRADSLPRFGLVTLQGGGGGRLVFCWLRSVGIGCKKSRGRSPMLRARRGGWSPRLLPVLLVSLAAPLRCLLGSVCSAARWRGVPLTVRPPCLSRLACPASSPRRLGSARLRSLLSSRRGGGSGRGS